MRQGCVLSPLLFNIFLADLFKTFDTLNEKIWISDESSIASIAWADDLVLLSETEEGLQNLLKTLERFCNTNKLLINTDKTKCMTFNKTGRLLRRSFFINGHLLDNVRSYKYLGFILTPSGEIRSGLQDLRDRALKAFMKIKNDMGFFFKQDIITSIHLIDSLVKPILLYCGDFWGCLKMPKNNPIENFHIMMCKHILGVQKQTTNIGVMLELGKVPIHFEAAKLSVKNWERIRLGQANELVLTSYQNSMIEKLPWIEGIKGTLENNGMLCLYQTTDGNTPIVYRKIFQRLSDQFHQNAFESIKKEESKLRTYAIFKENIGFEPYLKIRDRP